MKLRPLALALFVASLAGCHRWVEVTPTGTTEQRDLTSGVAESLAAGETMRVRLYEVRNGFSTQGFECDDDEGITSSDPTIVWVGPTGEEEVVNVNSYEIGAHIYSITALGVGDATLTAVCHGTEAQWTMHVH